MTKVTFGNYKFSIEETAEGIWIFDIVRKKKVLLTPEEWVRQHVLHYLIFEKKYSAARIAVERAIVVNNLTKRFDTLTFDRYGKPYLMVECKAENVHLNEEKMHQILIYNQALSVKFLWITNGRQNFCFSTTDGFVLLNEIPESD
jgi:hypothetical protein